MNELAIIKPSVPAFSMGDVERIAGAIAKSGMFGLKDPYGVLTLCLLAQAEGQHPAVVFRDYSVISGKPAKKAEAMLRDFINSGGKVEWHQLDDECADATFTHPAGTARIAWDKERAKKAGLGGNGMYAKYPRQMLRSRVISEGVRTVYPGATSGLYVPEEVSTFEPTNSGETVDIGTGEVTEHRDPPIPGITKIRNNLNKLRRNGAKATDLEAFNALVHDCRDDLQKIKEANHSLWTGMGEDFDGFKAWIKSCREALSKTDSLGFQMLCSAVLECKTTDELQSLLDEHDAAIAELDGEESKRFESAYNDREQALKHPTPVTAGAYGG